MWQVWNTSHKMEFDLAQSMQDLLAETMRGLIIAVGIVWLLWQILATALWPGWLDWQTWPITIILMALSAAVFRLIRGYLRLAQLLWLSGLFFLIALGVYSFRQPEILFLYPLLPLMAVLLVNWQVGLLFGGLIVACGAWFMVSAERLIVFTEVQAVILVVGCAISGLVGWASARSLFTVAHWSLNSFAEARRHTEEARHHRAQMMQLLKELDQAYYQLERTNAALVAARKAAEEAERFKTEFVTNVSHELRTPLNLIVGFTEMMMNAPENYGHLPLPGVYRSDMYSVYRSAQHLLALVDDVLDLARIEVGRIALARDPVDLSMLIDETTAIVCDYVTAKGLDLDIELDEDLPTIWIDRLRIRQVLLNLLVNAARHTERGQICVEARRQSDEIVVRVIDTGKGIQAKDLPKIFEEFRTTEPTFSQWHSGSGLGLSISKKFVELHQGRMGVESTYGKGASFWFSLPCTPVVAGATESQKRYHPVVNLGTSEPIIIVVHERFQVSSMLKRYMEGCQVIGVSTWKEGVEMAREVQASVLVVGVGQPIPAPPPENVLVVRCVLPDMRQAVDETGVEDLLIKPVTRQELLAAIDRLGITINNILVVDDDPEVVRLFRRMLRACVPGRNCREAYNGEEALRSMLADKPDLVLLDLIMPDIDGRTVLSRMAADPALADIPVIIVSAHGQDHTNLRLDGSIHLERYGGFELGEVVKILAGVSEALAPGWQTLKTNDPASSVRPPASQVWADRLTLPMPTQVGAR